ncbi:MAG: PQQ-binding-like beta-propeller repeat protein [Acidobacteriota bacterium]
MTEVTMPRLLVQQRRRVCGLLLAMLVAAGAATALASEAPPAWRQWGGPQQDFRAPALGLADRWPEEGPPELWRRPIGEGTSGILFEDGRLYTMHRIDEKEAVVCLDAATGETLWETRYAHDPHPRHVVQFGRGPSSTPLLVGDRLFTVGVAGKMHALDKRDGRIQWMQDLWGEDFGGQRQTHGYASSPVAYGETVIVLVGGKDASLVAFHQRTGEVRWRGLSFENSYSSPRLLTVAGEPQVVAFMAEELIGVDPNNGSLRWRYPHANPWKNNIALPAITGGDTLFLSSPQAGARGIRLIRQGDTMRAEEIWSNRRVQLYHGSAPQVGDWVYGSSGTSLAFMVAVDIRTGEIAWRERGIAKANCVEADGKLLFLDEDGLLHLATATPEKLVVHAKIQLLGRFAWTPPTVVGTVLFARDSQQIVAIDLG